MQTASSERVADEPTTIIVGAGPAGLAVAACLTRARIPFTMLEQRKSVGASWRDHYDRLHLHTNKGTSALPYMRFPRHFPRYPSRNQVIEYLDTYARAFGIEPRFEQEVVSARRHSDLWEVETRISTYAGQHLVIATGLSRQPVVPQWPGQESYRGPLVHSSAYRNGRAFSGKRVLVVGFGNSGAEIALDLHEHGAQPTIAVRGGVNVLPRDVFGIPIVVTAMAAAVLPPSVADTFNAPLLRLVLGNLRAIGLRPLPYGALTQIAQTGRIPMIDVGTLPLIRNGMIEIRPGVERFSEDGVVFSDGGQQPFDAVVLATGFRAGLDRFLEAEGVLDEDGNPAGNGRSLPEGLHLCGFRVVANGVLNQIARDARRIAARIASQPVAGSALHGRQRAV